MGKRKQIIRSVAAGLVIPLAALFLVEFAMRWVGYRPPGLGYAGWNSATSMNRPDSLNQLGFRGKQIRAARSPKEKIILLLGDSQVEANALPWEYLMENLLPEKLSDSTYTYVCYSLGSGGFGQDQQLLVLREYFKWFRADYVLLWFTPENDVWNNQFPTHWPANGSLKPTFWLEGDRLKGPHMAYLQHPKREESGSFLWDMVQHIYTDGSDRDAGWEEKLPPRDEPVWVSAPSALVYERAGADENFETGKTHYSIVFPKRGLRLQYGIDLTHALLQEIQWVAEQNHAHFLPFSVENGYLRNWPDSVFYVQQNDRYYALDKRMYHRNLSDIMAGLPFRYFRLASPWIQVSRDDNHHLNHTAQQEAADSLAAWLRQKDGGTR